MSYHQPPSGYNNVSEYQTSGIPWIYSGTVSGSTKIVFDFPFVTKSIVINNTGAATSFIIAGFTDFGMSNGRRIIVKGGTGPIQLDVRMGGIILQNSGTASDYSVTAALTTIPVKNMPDISKFPGYGMSAAFGGV